MRLVGLPPTRAGAVAGVACVVRLVGLCARGREALLLLSVGGSSGRQLDFEGELPLDFGGAPPESEGAGKSAKSASPEPEREPLKRGESAPPERESGKGAPGEREQLQFGKSAPPEPEREQLESESPPRLAVYTDGACLGNPGPGGWAWVVPEDQDAPEAGRQESGSEAETTSQRMELTAVLKALDSLRDVAALDVYSDSRYVVDCFEKRWWEGWMRRSWRTSAKKAVQNQDLWRPLLELALQRDVEFHWVKAHYGNRWNELADFLANSAARRLADG